MKNLYFIRSNGEYLLLESKIEEKNTIKFIKKFIKEKILILKYIIFVLGKQMKE